MPSLLQDLDPDGLLNIQLFSLTDHSIRCAQVSGGHE